MQEFAGDGGLCCDFLVVYVMEAHAADEWPLGVKRSRWPQAKTIHDREEAATAYRMKLGAQLQQQHQVPPPPFALDTMVNSFYSQFGAWPEVHLVIDGEGRLALRTETEHGTGLLADGPWEDQVRATLRRILPASQVQSDGPQKTKH